MKRSQIVHVVAAMLAVIGTIASAPPAAAQPYVYVLGQTDDPAPGNSGPQYVTVINTATNSKVARITAGTGCQCIGAQVLAISPDASRIFVANEQGASVTAIATATNSVVGTFGSGLIGTGPSALAVSPDATRLYVVAVGTSGMHVAVIDLASGTRLALIPLGVVQARGAAVSPDGSRLFVTTYGSNSVKVLDTASFTVVATVPIAAGSLPLTVNATPDGRFVYVAASFTNNIAVIDAQTNTLVTAVPVGNRPYSLAVSPSGSFVYTTNGNSGTVSRIGTATQTVTSTVSSVFNGRGIGFTPDGATAWAVGTNVYAIATATNAVVGTPISWNAGADGLPAALVVTPPPFTPPPPPPNPAPTNLTVTAITGNRVTLQWSAPSAGTPTGYVVEGGVAPGQVLGSLPTGSTAPSFSFDAPTGAFYLRVHALTASGRSPASNDVQVFVNVPQPPSAPTGLLGLVTGSEVVLAWKNTASGGAPTSLVLEVSGAVTASAPLALTEVFRFPAVPPGTYTFAVRATNATGTSMPSAPVTLTFPGVCSGVPHVPANFVASHAGAQLSLSWDLAATGPAPTGYVVRATGTLVGSVPVTTRSIAGPVPPGTYNLSVLAVNPCGQSLETVAQSVTIP